MNLDYLIRPVQVPESLVRRLDHRNPPHLHFPSIQLLNGPLWALFGCPQAEQSIRPRGSPVSGSRRLGAGTSAPLDTFGIPESPSLCSFGPALHFSRIHSATVFPSTAAFCFHSAKSSSVHRISNRAMSVQYVRTSVHVKRIRTYAPLPSKFA
jgi:hypothetical protein